MKILKVLAALVALWLVALVVIGLAGAARIEKRVVARVGEPLAATATVGSTELALIRGHLDLKKIDVERESGGHLKITVDEVRCDLPPFGLALVDDDCRTLSIKGMRVDVSAAGVFQIKSAKAPVHARRVVIDDAILKLSPSALAPSLGEMTITVEHAEAKDTMLKTPFSWIFALDQLKAKLEMPGDVVVQLGYANGKLSVGGSLFGSKPVELPFEIPVAGLADDPKAELAKLGALAKDVTSRVLAQKAKDWMRDKLTP